MLGAVPPQHFTAVTYVTDSPAPRVQALVGPGLAEGRSLGPATSCPIYSLEALQNWKEGAIPGRLQAHISVHLVTLQQ